MADDELVSFWDAVHPPRRFPPWPNDLDLEPPPRPKPPFCYKCGLPTRICDGSDHRAIRGSGDLFRWNEEEKILFLRKARLLTEEEKAILREKLLPFQGARGESFENWSAVRGDLIKAGRIPLGRWRIELYLGVLHGG